MGGDELSLASLCGNVTVRYIGGERAVFSQSCGNVHGEIQWGGGGTSCL